MTVLKNAVLMCLLVLSACQQRGRATANNGTPSVNLGRTNKRPQFSNIQFIKDNSDTDYYLRLKGGSNSIADLRKRLKIPNKDGEAELMSGDEGEKMKKGSDFTDNRTVHQKSSLTELRESLRSRKKHYVSEYNCDFESDCSWTWRKDVANGFFITSGIHVKTNVTGPKIDANGREGGNYLILRLPVPSTEYHVTSPLLGPTASSCRLILNVYQENMEGGVIRVVGDKTIDLLKGTLNNHTQWVVNTIHGNNLSTWKKEELSIGKITSNFTILLEVVPAMDMSPKATVAFDNIQLYQCFIRIDDTCSFHQYRCNVTKECINATSVCDFIKDCRHGDDEMQNCHVMPYGSRCTFEDDEWCGWRNADPNAILQWSRNNGSTPSNFTGPNVDHTYMNNTGSYLFVNMNTEKSTFASAALLKSVVFNPPPRVHGNISSTYFNSCAIRFYVHKTGKHKSALQVLVTELTPNENKTAKLYWSYMDDHGDQWTRLVLLLPNVTHRYFVTIEAKKGYRFLSDVAIDDVSLTPECFGINIPAEELQGYNYWNPKLDIETAKETVDDFKNRTYYKFTTCGSKGRFGPSHQGCVQAYKGTPANVWVMQDAGWKGIQKWSVPRSSYYTIFVSGAGGGKGSTGMGSSRGAQVRAVLKLEKGQEIYLLVGQEGSSACIKFLGQSNNCSVSNEQFSNKSLLHVIRGYDIIDSGGGGGGGTFVFKRNRTKHSIPLAIAAGGGGLSISRIFDKDNYHGQGFRKVERVSGSVISGAKSGGAGGGWTTYLGMDVHSPMNGDSLLRGGQGGVACYESQEGRGHGGFGGGGGGCKYGGGGGGYAGGNVNSSNGDGGISYVDSTRTEASFAKAEAGYNPGHGYVVIIPAVEGCNCDYLCIALDEQRSETTCICPENWLLADKKSCIPILTPDSPYPPWFVVALIVTVFCLTVAFGMVCFVLLFSDNRYQQQVSGLLRRKGCPVSDVQLSRLRQASGSVTTQYNPNYEFGGVVTTIADLQHIPREQLRLVKALGQGAFGEVYQGCYRQRPCDTVEMPVAVKTLQEMTVKQAEDDFLTEALIMSKFNHPNIVHFIGVCFDKHPKFIVLELLTGGDLKNFLRESRPKPDRPSPITMRDLVLIAIDISRGCRYLEEKRFIHRDIAARNCLLTTKGPGRVTKIADFGMSRDIYRADYYRKDGKAMLPVKWMPPEAFLEGIFSTKTDVWSFGILLWEIMKMGFMPYTGCTNKEVMDLVVQGGRLERPENCPGPIYGIMASCWHPQPEDRPNFATILERLGYCLQDPDVTNAPLPMFYVNVSSERDTTVIRPSDSNDNCLQVLPNPSDYLVPNHTIPATPDAMESTSSVEKLIPDGSRDHWETSFIMPNSKSTQPLLADSIKEDDTGRSSHQALENATGHQNHQPSLKSGVSLDPRSLMAPHQKKRYANVDENGMVQNGGYSIKYVGKNDGEINC
ncbi:tyrosine-protein kinase receptor isoform X2 [Euwallacea similis]|uniref:tyrosine-protein kinase receptor isoform X2 n=1 Tax=Euwallacea similis TaxID=1736056 RepID=UPI00344C5841